MAPGDGRHPDLHPLPTVPPVIPCNRVRHFLKRRGIGPCSAAACGQGMRGTDRRTGGRWGHTGHQLQRTARPGGTAVLGTPVGPGSQHHWERGSPHAIAFTNASTHLIGVRPLEALAGQLLALGRGAGVGVLRHSLPAIEGASPGRPHWAHAHRGDTRGGHNTCHASRAQAVGATGPGMGQELAAERLPCAHLQQQRERGHGRVGGSCQLPSSATARFLPRCTGSAPGSVSPAVLPPLPWLWPWLWQQPRPRRQQLLPG